MTKLNAKHILRVLGIIIGRYYISIPGDESITFNVEHFAVV